MAGQPLHLTDDNVLMPQKTAYTFRMIWSDWDFLFGLVEKMPDKTEWARNLGWWGSGVFIGTAVSALGWLQIWNGLSKETQRDNTTFWFVYAFVLAFSALVALVGMLLNKTLAASQETHKQTVLDYMNQTASKHERPKPDAP